MSKSKAAVPASKARIGTIYAVRDDDGALCRFRVKRITTHRIDDTGSPHDYESEIGGEFILSVDDQDKEKIKAAVIKPHRLLGEFKAYAELQAAHAVEEKAKRDRLAQEQRDMLDLWRLFYEISGVPCPNDHDDFYAHFRASRYGGADVTVSTKGLDPLLKGLRKLVGTRLGPGGEIDAPFTVEPEKVR